MSANAQKLQKTYQSLCDYVQQTAMLSGVEELLQWDECTKMPPAAGPYRAEQVALVAGILHKRHTDSRLGEWLAELEDSPLAADPHSEFGTNIRLLARDYEKKTKLPQKLVEELSRTSVLAQQTWAEARKNDDFASFAPLLEKTFELKRQEAAALGFNATPYDPLLDDYEPGESTANVASVLGALREEIVPLVQEIIGSNHQPDRSVLEQDYEITQQEKLGRHVAEQIGYDFNAGRLDTTVHPFCCTPGAGDVRICTRYSIDNFENALFSTIHEVGHALYEQGLVREQHGLPTGTSVSLGIHESQSRMWENQVAFSRGFWKHFFPVTQEHFPTVLKNSSPEAFYAALNCVRPSLIRVDADEVTYNLHIFIRFEIEQALLEERLSIADLPEAWNAKYQEYLGLTPPSNAEGVMQDVHWGAGLVGYFPTYALGNLYAAQFYAKAEQDLGDLQAAFAEGEFGGLLGWLREHIHQPGQRYSPAELVERVTGEPLSHEPLLSQLRSKYGELYRL
ncbi:carboxypeptidase M32 [Adhaeretor mobilis]|uniref:Metal-dependent carboxypeptidase n=1 Tax=Adhaeretor mobilis TaxID=1930276 RepID=A0A517MRU7_9BACT|nr:carboxypeptidase M32 [Adhaeretor mobilis]QDS97507.1 Thermostable carboxypeptidase 1 [Adhaeretor mobilis]